MFGQFKSSFPEAEVVAMEPINASSLVKCALEAIYVIGRKFNYHIHARKLDFIAAAATYRQTNQSIY
jgi:hypothetical protein